jgi:hypothetical protein
MRDCALGEVLVPHVPREVAEMLYLVAKSGQHVSELTRDLSTALGGEGSRSKSNRCHWR